MPLMQAIKISKALLTPVIAVVATYIAWQQWKTNRQKLVLDQYDRRLSVYEEVRKILSIILRDARASYADLLKFRTAVSEADFLFGPEISAYIEEVYQRGVQLEFWSLQYCDFTQTPPQGYDHQKVCDGKHSELTWFTKQFEPAKEKFKKNLDVSK
jgi:hypothetical protein